jgi:predicted O-methyltransferase YrrM
MKHSYFKIPGWFNYSESYDIIADRISEDGKILEIGSFMGRSTHYLATTLHNANKENVKIYALDTFKGSSEHANLKMPKDFLSIFEKNLKFFIDKDVIEVLQSRSDNKDMIDRFDDEFFDYIMIDGAHEYEAVKKDIENWWPKLKKDGVMFGDDFNLKAVSAATQESFKKLNSKNLGVNQSSEQTWFSGKNIENARSFEKLVPGQNTLL